MNHLKKAISVFLTLCLLIPMFCVCAGAFRIVGWNGDVSGGFASGKGTLTDPYIIETAEQFAYMAKMTRYGYTYEGQFIKLTSSIDLGNREWMPAGIFSGYFDGGGNTVYNWKITEYYIHTGLFGRLHDATIKNFGISNFTINIDLPVTTEGICVGGIAGVMDGKSALNGCYVSGEMLVQSGDSNIFAGLIVGNMYDCQIIDCFAYGDITATIKNPKYHRELRAYTGGISGLAYKSKLINCYAFATVAGTNSGIIAGLCISELWDCFYYVGKTYTEPFYYSSVSGNEIKVFTDKSMLYLETFKAWDFEHVWELIGKDGYRAPTLINAKLLNHTTKKTYEELPTCTEEGFADYKCSRCNESIHVILPANGHDYGEWVIIKEPLQYANGTKRRTCNICNADEYASIPMLSAEKATEITTVLPETTKATMPTIFIPDAETTTSVTSSVVTTNQTSTTTTTKATTTETTTPVITEKPVETTTSLLETTTTQNEQTEKKSPLKTLIILIIVGSVLLVILGGVLFFIMKQKKD